MLFDPKWEPQSQVLKILAMARKLIERPEDWCQRYSQGQSICAVHALQKASRYFNVMPDGDVEAYRALGVAIGVADPECGPSIGHWNDSHTHADVLAAFDRAIENARAEALSAP